MEESVATAGSPALLFAHSKDGRPAPESRTAQATQGLRITAAATSVAEEEACRDKGRYQIRGQKQMVSEDQAQGLDEMGLEVSLEELETA